MKNEKLLLGTAFAFTAILLILLFFLNKAFAPSSNFTGDNSQRKGSFTIKLTDSKGNPILGTANITQKKHEFIFGAAINPWIVKNLQKGGEKCLAQIDSLFNLVVDESMFKWEKSEAEQGKINFTTTQKIANWAEENNKKTRHHCLFWSNPENQPDWVLNLSASELEKAIYNRINYTKKAFSGNIVSLDLVNEMIHYDFYRSKLGNNIIKDIYTAAKENFPDIELHRIQLNYLTSPILGGVIQ